MRTSLNNFGILVVFIIITFWSFLPLWKNITGLLPDDSDGVVITWSLNKVVQNGSLWPKKLLTGNILYPYPYSHAYTDPYITDSLIAFPFIKIIKEPVIAFNANLLISQILLLFFTFLFLKQITKDFLISLFLSLVFGFSKMRVHYLGHLQMFSLYWVTLSGYFLLKLAESKKSLFLLLFFLAFLGQALNSFLPGYFILMLVLGLLISIRELKLAIIRNPRTLLVGSVLTLVILIAYIRPYLVVASFFNYSRPIKDVVHFSLSPEAIFQPKFFSPVLFGLFFVSLVSFFSKKEKKIEEKTFLLFSMVALTMALGPVLHLFGKTLKVFGWPVPLPYFIFYYLLPGFKGFRTPSRWLFMAGFWAVVFSAVVLSRNLKGKAWWSRWLFGFIILVLLVLTNPLPREYVKIPRQKEYPEVYTWLMTQPGKVILEMPIYSWRDSVLIKKESFRELYSLKHNKKMVNGTTGFTPPPFEKFVEYMREDFPSDESLLVIKKILVDYLIIHENEFKDLWPEGYQKKLEFLNKHGNLKELYRGDQNVVYEFK